MKLNLKPIELEEKIASRKFSDEKSLLLVQKAIQKAPVALQDSFENDEGKIISCVIIESWKPGEKPKYGGKPGKGVLTFRSFWNRCFQVVCSRTKKLLCLVIESEYGKHKFMAGQERPVECKFSTNGNGVGEKVSDESQELFATLISEHEFDPLVVAAINFYKGRDK